SHYIFIAPALHIETARRNLQTFLENFGAAGAPASETHAANVVPVAFAHGKGHKFPVGMNRHYKGDVVKVASGDEWVVQNDNVARLQCLSPVMLKHGLDVEIEHPDEGGRGDCLG